MPFTIDEERMRKQASFDVSAAPNSPTGIPIKQIPHQEFPRVIYKHPTQPFRKIEHRNTQHEVVDVETVPAEHLTKVVNDEKELKRAIAEGWVLKSYIPQAAPDPNAELYETTK